MRECLSVSTRARLLLHLPEAYLVWFRQNGFPPGKLGEQLQIMLDIKMNGLEPLLKPLIRPDNERN